MPLSRSCKRTAVSKNIKTLMKEGRPQKQAVAIALSTARKSGCAVKKAPKKGGKAGRAAPCGCSKAGRAGSRAGTSDRLFIGVYPTGISYADRGREKDGDYAKVGFLPYDTLKLEVYSGAPAALVAEVKKHAATVQKKRGEKFAYDASGHYVTLGSKAGRAGYATPMRERSPIQIGKSVGGYRFDDHRHTTRQKVGLLMQQWHSSMGDPIYAVGSYYFANVVYPDADVVRRAHSALKRDLDHAKAGEHGWGRNEVLQLGTILAYLDWALDHDYSKGQAYGYAKGRTKKRGRAGGHPTHFNDPFAYHSEVQFLVERAGFHRDDVIEFTNRDSAANIIDEQRKKHRTPSHAAAWMIAEMRKAGFKNRESGRAGGYAEGSPLGAPIKRIPKAYMWLVVDPAGNVWTGNEYKSDAQDALKEIKGLIPDAKVMSRAAHDVVYVRRVGAKARGRAGHSSGA